MLVSSDFNMRTCGPVDGSRLPEEKSETREHQADLVLRRSGRHQSFLDVSRCPLLRASFLNRSVPACCANLLFLDVSYTACDDLSSVFRCCTSLRALNLAGLSLLESSLEGIEELSELEALSLRGSNVDDISSLCHLSVLRSLDLGLTRIHRLDHALSDKERLEELLLDGCQTEFADLFVRAMASMKRLKVVNLHEGAFAFKRAAIARAMEFPVFFEPYSRRLMFFDAVLRNDYKAVFRFLSAGQDVNARVDPRDQRFLTRAYLSRCVFAKTNQRTPFFLCHEKSAADLRPNALHLAIFFNCLETVQILLEAYIDRTAQVLIVEVAQDANDSDTLIEDTSPAPAKPASVGAGANKMLNALIQGSSKKHRAATRAADSTLGNSANTTTDPLITGEDTALSTTDAEENSPASSAAPAVTPTGLASPSKKQILPFQQRQFTPMELVHFIFEKNIHRLTQGLAQQKVINWKAVCETFRNRLLFVLDSSTHTPAQRDALQSTPFEEIIYHLFFPVEMETIESRREKEKAREDPNNATKELAKLMHLKISDAPTDHHAHDSARHAHESERDTEEGKRSVRFADEGTDHHQSTHTHNHKHAHNNVPRSDDELTSDNFEAEKVVRNFHNPFNNAPKYGRLSAFDEEEEKERETQRQAELQEKNAKRQVQMLPKKPRLVQWREHGLVCKLIGQPTTYALPRESTLSDNWMTTSSFDIMNINTMSTAANISTAGEASEIQTRATTAEIATSTRAASRERGALTRPSSRAALLSRKPSARIMPTFAPLERLRALSVKGLTLASDPDNKPFSRFLSAPKSPEKEKAAKKSPWEEDGEDVTSEYANKPSSAGLQQSEKAQTLSNLSAVEEVRVLGKKSYWLDGKRLAVEEKLKIMEEAFERQMELERNKVYRDGRIKKRAKKRDTIDQRRRMFMEYLQKRLESQYEEED